MNENFKDDKAVLKERKAPLQGVEAPLREQIVQELFRKLDDRRIGDYVVKQWETANAHRANWLERQQAYLSEWDDFLLDDTSGSFAGFSNLHIPITFIVTKSLHARYSQAIWSDPPFTVKAEKAAFVEAVPIVRDVMRHSIMKWGNFHQGSFKVVDSWVWRWIAKGSGILKDRWDVQYTRFKDVRPIKKEGPPRVEIIDGREVYIPTLIDDEEEFDNTKKCFDGPVHEEVPVEDFVMVGGKGDPDLADEVYHRSWLTASELWTLSDRKVFNEDAVREAIDGGRNYQGGATANEIKQQQAHNAGQASVDNEAAHDRYEILEGYLRIDVDGSGIASDVIVWVHAKSRRLLRATYLYRVHPKGKRPFAKADYHLRDGQEYGIGIPELMYPLQKEIDAMHNLRVDFGLISTMPFGFYRASSSLDPKVINYEPGSLIPLDDPQRDVYFPNMGNRTVFGFQEEQAIDQLIQRLTGVNELAMGMIGGQGVTRTASGARALVGEMSANLDVHLRRLAQAWSRALQYRLELLQLRLPKGLSFRISGEDGMDIFRSELEPGHMEGDYAVEVSANSAASNPGVQQEQASQVFQLVQNPLAIQMGVVQPQHFYEAARNMLQSMGIKDWGKYIGKPQGYEFALTPVQEADAVLAGIPVPIRPNSDHEGFINFVDMFLKEDHLSGQLNEQQTAALQAQAMKHMDMLEAMKAAQAQAANSRQMRTNAEQSQQQAPTGMSPAAGAGGM